MGLFNLFGKPKKSNGSDDAKRKFSNDVERDMYENNRFGYREMKDSLDYQNRLLSRVNAAQAKYKQDGDLDAVIKELEYAFIQSNPPCKTSQNMDLVNYYIKAGRNNDAWGYLNRLITTQEAPLEKIRFAQARILKKEKKWDEAIRMYMLGYLTKSKWNNTFQKEMFIKDIKSSANKLKWDDSQIDKLAQIVERHVKKKDYSEASLDKDIKKALSDFQNTAS